MVDRRGHPASRGTTCRHFRCGVADPPCTCRPRRRAVLAGRRPDANSHGYCPTWRYRRHRERRAWTSAIESPGRTAVGRLPGRTAPTSAILVACERGCASLSRLGCYPISTSIENAGTMFHITGACGGSSEEHPPSNWRDMTRLR